MGTHARTAQHSILDDLGEEVTGILTPVSVCMALTVMLVKTLNPTGASDARSVYIASAFYSEKVSRSSCPRLSKILLKELCRCTETEQLCTVQVTDSVSTKVLGALINASVFVAIVTLMTFLLVFLFKRGVRVVYDRQ